jgi:hypothetical protein
VDIERNTIAGGPYSVGHPGTSNRNTGMFLIGSMHRSTPVTTDYRVLHNTIITDNNLANGIYLNGIFQGNLKHSNISSNHIIMNRGITGIILFSATNTQKHLVAHNKIEGAAAQAIALFATPGGSVTDNVLIGNNLNKFSSTAGREILLVRAHNNVIVGDAGNVLAIISNKNEITGINIENGVGEEITDVLKEI